MLESLSCLILQADERFRQEKNLTYISKWIRKSIRQHDSFDQSLEGLKSFFRDVKVFSLSCTIHTTSFLLTSIMFISNIAVHFVTPQVEKNSSMQPIDVEPIDIEKPRNWFTEMRNNKLTKPNQKGSISVSDGFTTTEITPKMKKSAVMTTEYDCSLAPQESKAQKVRPCTMSDNNTGITYVNLKGDLETQNRYTNIVISIFVSTM